MSSSDALGIMIFSASMLSKNRNKKLKPGQFIESMPKETREALLKLTSDEASKMTFHDVEENEQRKFKELEKSEKLKFDREHWRIG